MDSIDVVKVSKFLLAPHGRTFLWNYSDGLASDPWALGDALQNAIHHVRSHSAISYTPLSDLLQGISSSAASSNNLFDASKSYLLIGGLGSLGLHVALWMYEKGARDIVLTSRSGVESLQRRGGDFIALRILHYLEQRADLSIKTAAVDAASADGMAALVRAVLSDGMFQSHTAETFERAFTPKVQAFHALQRAVDLESLDFFVTFSSVSGLFGNAGQTSYSAANAALAGLTRRYKNAFSIVPPIILDTSILTMSEDGYNTRVRHMVSWGMTAREVCDYVGDGIMKLREGATVWQYIPDLDWRAVRFADDGRSHQVYGHLVPTEEQEAVALGGDKKVSLSQIVCQVLDLKVDDVSIDVPLTSYGLDSLYAAALSFALRPILTISQIQLLADVTMDLAEIVEGEA
ncbi:KR domain-containing protein [Daedaleopsis nitida]|nr:KR domain-containing protein [Daedaleopsis nitida]